MNAENDYNAMPDGLSKAGKRAHDVIMRVLREHDMINTGGCRTFYSPAEWRARGEEYGVESVLVVVYDGGDVRPFFAGYEYGWALEEKMRSALEAAGLWAERCTGWYSAIYEDG